MKQFLQSEFLDRQETEVEDQLTEVISGFQNLPEEILLKPGPGNGWSVAECFAHLNSYAEFYNPRIEKAIAKAQVIFEPVIFSHSFLGSYFIKSMNPDLSRNKFRAMKKHIPAYVDDPNKTVSAFIAHLENMLALLRFANQKSLKKCRVQTSISPLIKINAGDAIAFVITHNRRHLQQARRALGSK
jgi:hypothetical protein